MVLITDYNKKIFGDTYSAALQPYINLVLANQNIPYPTTLTVYTRLVPISSQSDIVNVLTG